MCVNKIRVFDLLHGRTASYFPCGRCKSCRQAAADRRSRMIRGHHRAGMFCYFITLSYARNCPPYIKISDLNEKFDEFQMGYNISDTFNLPIYRDVEIYKTGRKDRGKLCKSENKIIGFKELSNDIFISPENFSDIITSLSPLRYYVKKELRYELDKISVAFTPDSKDFFKRLRQNLFRDFGKRIPLEYYMCPEYGPTTGRFHIHALLWLPSSFSELQVKHYVATSWPYASPVRTKQYVQYAKNPANYLASYVNCDSTTSSFLTENFKLRSSHSLDFGFNENIFGFEKFFDAYKHGRFTYVGVVARKDGTSSLAELPYPRYVAAKYMPIFKGLGRLTKHTAIHVYKDPRKYFSLTPSITREREDGTTYHMSNIKDGRGHLITFTKYESIHYIKVIERAYLTYFRPLGYSRNAFALEVYHYWNNYFTYLYKQSMEDKTPIEQARTFYNLSDLYEQKDSYIIQKHEKSELHCLHFDSSTNNELLFVDGKTSRVRNFSLEQVVDSYPFLDLDPNTFLEEKIYTQQKIEKYNRNIKLRKINSYNSI